MVTLHWNDFAENDAFHVSSLTLRGRASFYEHDHDFAELFLIDLGTGVHRMGASTETVQEGDLATILPQAGHGFQACTEEGFRYLNVAFPLTVVDQFRAAYLRPGDGLWTEGHPFPPRHRLSAAKKRLVHAMIEQLSLAPRVRYEIDRFLLNLLHELREPAVARLGAGFPAWLGEVYEEMLTGAGPAPTVERLVTAANRSHEHVARVCRKCTGLTPTQLVNSVKLTRAAHLLAMGEDDITRVALDCGFTNLGHFYKVFRQQFGVTPRRYRLVSKGMA
jgi:AraC family cel operon transcriptional repressor